MPKNFNMTDPPPNSNTSPKSPGLKRRNGQQAACEPCRKAKLKCDHALPVCSRCRKRRKPGQCIVIGSPTARAELPYHNWSVSQQSASNGEVGRATIKASAETSGFLGPTSFAATVQHGDLEDPKAGSEAKPGMGVVDSDQLRLGVQVLMALPTEQACHDLLEWYLDTVVVVASHKLTRRLTLKAFWHSYGHLLQNQRNKGDLENIARELFHNGSISLKQIDDPMEWIASFSGTNTRWEVLGLLFVAFAYAILSGPEHILNAGFGVKNVDRDGLVGQMKKCVERCIELCRGSLNLLVCNLLYWNALLETVLSGDSSMLISIIQMPCLSSLLMQSRSIGVETAQRCGRNLRCFRFAHLSRNIRNHIVHRANEIHCCLHVLA